MTLKTADAHAADAAADLAYAIGRYHDAMRVLSPALAMRATAAEMVRGLLAAAADCDVPAEEVARSLAVALLGACRGVGAAVVIERLRSTADWLDASIHAPVRVDAPADVPTALAAVRARRVA